ncbi:CYFIP-related Rac1 interactor B-like [Physella acuta]|uniref:CYFIP-related Rac1 interactor B-like n=1 Tax=Physella acuta TaxID=109671 RepID=UPI0027DDA92A|nr:CYFIP-related Rac1 interactor B-like [Physella acuta]
MGNLLRILLNNDPPSKHSDNIFVDFENAQPSPSEERVWLMVKKVLDMAQEVLLEIQRYSGATEEIRMAISNPKIEDLQDKAWQSVTPLVSKLKKFFEFSLELERVIPELLGELCSEDLTPREHLEQQQSLFKQFAEILDFVLKFDDIKMTTPAMQNDFSYYRRTLNRRKMANEDEIQEGEEHVSNELANRMSLFYAQSTPMLKSLSDVTAKFVSQHKDLPLEQTTDCLSMMANICRVMIENDEYKSRMKEETRLFCLRVMVGVIILYDHVHPLGAFTKTSSIEMKSSIKLLKDQERTKVEALLNALRYTTKHLQDVSTSKTLKTMLAD